MNPDRATPEPSLRSLVTERFHGNGTAVEALEIVERHGATVTATLLVCTHRRFERCARTLMRDLAASGLLDEGPCAPTVRRRFTRTGVADLVGAAT